MLELAGEVASRLGGCMKAMDRCSINALGL